eukprot:s1179_g8.t1
MRFSFLLFFAIFIQYGELVHFEVAFPKTQNTGKVPLGTDKAGDSDDIFAAVGVHGIESSSLSLPSLVEEHSKDSSSHGDVEFVSDSHWTDALVLQELQMYAATRTTITSGSNRRPPINPLDMVKAAAVKQEGQVLLSAVQSLTDAKNELADAQKQRSVLHGNWTKFLQAQIAKWQEYADQFQKAEASAVARIQAAQTTYSSACDILNNRKIETGVSQQAEEVLDADDPSLRDVSMTNSTKIGESIQSLQATLTTLQKSAEEIAEQEMHAPKRLRTAENTNVAPDGSMPGAQLPLGHKALQPFGGAG